MYVLLFKKSTKNMGTFLENLGEGAATQGASGIVGAGLGLLLQGSQDRRQIRQQQKLTDMQTAANKDMAKFNYGQQMQMWHDTNYGPQMEELKKAGLNPALIYGSGGGAGGTTAAAQAQGASGGSAAGQSGEIMGMMQQGLQAQMMQAQIKNIDADTANKQADTLNKPKTGLNIEADTNVKTQTLENLKAQVKNTEAETKLTKVQTQIAAIQKTIQESTEEDQIRQIDLEAQQIQQEVLQLRNQTDISDATKQDIITTIKQTALNTIIEGNLKKANINLTNEQITKISADIIQRGQEIDIKQFEATMRANFPSLGEIGGNMLNSIKRGADKILGISNDYVLPNKPTHK